jgi:polar amino acid transport system substrate-binding protein
MEWFRTTWGKVVIGLVAVLAIVLVIVAVTGGDDEESAADTTTTTAAEETTTTAAEETTTTAAEETTTTAVEETTTTTEAPEACAVENLPLVTAGTLTVATGDVVFPPWMGVGDDNFDVPESGTGFEGALVYELAAEMGFAADQVTFVRTGFDEAIAPGPKDWDFNIQQYSITETRDEVVDFSNPYYTTKQSLVSIDGTSVIGATSLADLADARLGAAIGTTSLDFIEEVIQPNEAASVYDDNVDLIAALVAGQIDGMVVDLPTAYFMTAVQIPEQGAEGIIVAQFAIEAADPDEYGMLFADGNELVTCVNEALGVLVDNGTLEALEDEWLAQGGEIPTISE